MPVLKGACPIIALSNVSAINYVVVYKKVSECLIYGVWVSGKDWVQDVGPYGHWQYNTISFCILSHDVEVEVTECLPWSAPQP